MYQHSTCSFSCHFLHTKLIFLSYLNNYEEWRIEHKIIERLFALIAHRWITHFIVMRIWMKTKKKNTERKKHAHIQMSLLANIVFVWSSHRENDAREWEKSEEYLQMIDWLFLAHHVKIEQTLNNSQKYSFQIDYITTLTFIQRNVNWAWCLRFRSRSSGNKVFDFSTEWELNTKYQERERGKKTW